MVIHAHVTSDQSRRDKFGKHFEKLQHLYLSFHVRRNYRHERFHLAGLSALEVAFPPGLIVNLSQGHRCLRKSVLVSQVRPLKTNLTARTRLASTNISCSHASGTFHVYYPISKPCSRPLVAPLKMMKYATRLHPQSQIRKSRLRPPRELKVPFHFCLRAC